MLLSCVSVHSFFCILRLCSAPTEAIAGGGMVAAAAFRLRVACRSLACLLLVHLAKNYFRVAFIHRSTLQLSNKNHFFCLQIKKSIASWPNLDTFWCYVCNLIYQKGFTNSHTNVRNVSNFFQL